MIRGSCCCGGVKFALSEPPTMMATCHCSRCRKLGTSVFVFVRAETFRWLAGEDLVRTYQPTEPYKYGRRYCSVCATSLGEPGAGESFPINAQCLDDDPVVRNRFHEFVAEKPAWSAICDDAKQFEGHPVRI